MKISEPHPQENRLLYFSDQLNYEKGELLLLSPPGALPFPPWHPGVPGTSETGRVGAHPKGKADGDTAGVGPLGFTTAQ